MVFAVVKKISLSTLEQRVKEHKLWIEGRIGIAAPDVGEQLILIETEISSASFKYVDLSSCAISRSLVSNSRFEHCTFHGCTAVNSVFRECEFLQCDFSKAELQESRFHGCKLIACNLRKADLTSCDLRDADLTECNFSWAWLIDTDMRNAVLENIDLTSTRISGAKLYNSGKYHLKGVDTTKIKSLDYSAKGDNSGTTNEQSLDPIRIE